MSETLETKARRIGDDIAAVWSLIQQKGGRLPHTLNTENLQDVITQYGSFSQWNSKGLFLYNYDQTFVDFYTYHEVMRMTELPPAPAGSDGWPLTLEQVQEHISQGNHFLVMVADGTTTADLIMEYETTSANSPIQLYFGIELPVDEICVISWGDGTTTPIMQTTEYCSPSHTYATIGTYTIAITLPDGGKLYVGKTSADTQNLTILGRIGSAGAVNASRMKNLKSVYFDDKIYMRFNKNNGTTYYTSTWGGYPAGYNDLGMNDPSSNSYSRSGISAFPMTSDLSKLQSGAFTGAKFTNIQVPEMSVYPSAMFQYCTDLQSASFSGSLTVIPEYMFFYCTSLTTTNIDWSQITSVGMRAFAFTKCFNYPLDLTNITYLGSAAFNSTNVSEVIMPISITNYSESAPNNDKLGAFARCNSLSKVTFPAGATKVPSGAFMGDKNLSTIVWNNTLTDIGTRAFGGVFYDENHAFDMRDLPSSIEKLSGFNNCHISYLSLPTNIKKLGQYAFSSSTIHDGIDNLANLPNDTMIDEYALAFASGTQQLSAPLDMSNWIFSIGGADGSSSHLLGPTNIEVSSLPYKMVYTNMNSDYLPSSFLQGLNSTSGVGRDFIIPPIYWSNGQQVVNVSTGRYSVFADAHAKKLDFRNFNLRSLNEKTFYLWSSGAAPTQDIVNGVYEYIIDLSHNTSIPTGGYGPTDWRATFFVGNRTVNGNTISVRPKIIVPDSLYSDWIAASNWTAYAQYVVKESEA